MFQIIQNISDYLNLACNNTACVSTYCVNGNATITKPHIIENRIYSTTYAQQTTDNQKQNKLSYTPIPLNGPMFFNQDIHIYNVQNCENMPPRNVTINNACNMQKKNMHPSLDPYEKFGTYIYP